MDQFVNKRDEQNISKTANFNAGLEAENIIGHDDLIPTVDGKDLTQYFHENVAVLLALEKNKHFNTITIGSEAELKINNKINDYNLKERVNQIVRTDVAEAEISGDKVVEGATNNLPITADNLLATIPSWGKSFAVTFQVKIDSLNGNNGGWMELLRFTSNENNDQGLGARIPAIFLNSNDGGYMHICTQIGADINLWQNFDVTLGTWIPVKLMQYQDENNKVIFN